MQKLLLLLALCLPAFATRIQDSNIRDSSGRMITSGKISVCPPGSFISGTWWISKDCVQVSINGGNLNINLQPGTYRAHWVTPAIEDQSWLVPDSGTPLRIQDIVNTRTGFFCGNWVGGMQVDFAACPTGGGGGGTTLWSTLGGTEWSSLSDLGWATLGN